jgi:diguanylate cyclase (GGDEF)-like protein
VHAMTVVSLGASPRGALASDAIQLLLGLMLLLVTLRTARRCRGLIRSYWCIAALAYLLLVTAQFLSVMQDLSPRFDPRQWTTFLFSFWAVALGMSLLLDPDSEAGTLDPLTYLAFVQGILFLLAAYFYFVLPSMSQSSGDLARSVEIPYVTYNGVLSGAFLFRSELARSTGPKAFLRRMGLFTLASCLVDVLYYYGPGKLLATGAWFDLFWSGLLVLALVMAETWKDTETADPIHSLRAATRNQLVTQLFALIFPVLIVLMSLRIAQQRLVLASTVLLVSLACSSARLLLTQKRLLATQEALRRKATHDGLTSLWNHTAILATLDRELLRAQRENGSVGVMMIDVDKFKSVNDSYGHAAGDAVLKALARGVSDTLRSYDSLGRYGGEEFLVVVPGCDFADCCQLAERIRDHVAKQSVHIGDSSISVTISIGVATSSESVYSAGPLLQAADTALYKAKAEGRNRVESVVPAVKAT